MAPVELLAACHPSLTLGNRGAIEVGRLAPYPLLLLDGGFAVRRAFDAACRLAGIKQNIMLESRAPHTLLALAEAGHGVAIIPSAVRTHRYALRIVGLTYRGKLLREPLTIFWDKRRPLPSYATAFCEMLAEYVREVFPITRPSEPKPVARRKRPLRAEHRRGREANAERSVRRLGSESPAVSPSTPPRCRARRGSSPSVPLTALPSQGQRIDTRLSAAPMRSVA